MTRFELSISPTYVPTWGLTEAIRELFQNALDQQTINPANVMSYDWDDLDKCFYISSKESILEKSSLLLGCSSKASDETTIGKFGEGYKLALLVLIRLNYKVTIYNYAAKEVWIPKIIKSRRYKSDLLVIDVKKHIFSSVPDSDLTFKISGITPFDINLIMQRNLFMQTSYNKIDTHKGEILLDEHHRGMLFVNGLYITTVDQKTLQKGYNFIPKVITLDRDRVLVDTFNLHWNTSEIWAKANDTDLCKDLILSGSPDVKYLDNFLATNTVTISEKVFDSFQRIHGLDTIPISNQYDFAQVKKKYPRLKPIIVTECIAKIMNKSNTLISMKNASETSIKDKTIKEQIQELVEEYKFNLPSKFVDKLDIILENSNDIPF